MITSYQFSQRFDPVSVMAGATVALFAFLRTLLAIVGLAVCLGAIFAVVFTFWLPIAQIAGCLAIVAAFAWVTFPRTEVRNG